MIKSNKKIKWKAVINMSLDVPQSRKKFVARANPRRRDFFLLDYVFLRCEREKL